MCEMNGEEASIYSFSRPKWGESPEYWRFRGGIASSLAISGNQLDLITRIFALFFAWGGRVSGSFLGFAPPPSRFRVLGVFRVLQMGFRVWAQPGLGPGLGPNPNFTKSHILTEIAS
jgi:hypothetical protein